MIHALHIFTELRSSDVSDTFLAFLSSYDRKELFVTVILPQESPFIRAVEKTGHPPIILKNISGTPRSFLGRRALKKEIRRLSPQIIHVYGGWVCEALRKCSVPIVNSPRDIETARRDKGKGFRRILARSPWAAERYIDRGIPEKSIRIVPNGMIPPAPLSPEEITRLRERYGFTSDDCVAGVFHPLRTCKGYPLFFAAAAAAVKECPELKFLVVGNGPMRRAYMRKVVSLGIKKSVKFVQHYPNRIALQNIIDFQVDVSENHPLSRTVLEAMGLAKPVIAFRSGGNSYAIENGVTGLLADQFMSKKLSGAMVQLTQKSAVCSRLGQGGKKRMNAMFSAEVTAKKVVEVYHEILVEEGILDEDSNAPSAHEHH